MESFADFGCRRQEHPSWIQGDKCQGRSKRRQTSGAEIVMRVLVTGSSGWLCRTLIPMLAMRGHAVTGLDVVAGPHTQICGSVGDRELIEAVFDNGGFDAVIHAGALHKPDIARYPAQAFIDVNVTGTLNLLQAAGRRPGVRFVFTSTTSLMISRAIREESGPRAVWLDERSGPIEPRNIYGVTKHAAENLCRMHHLEHGAPVVILRTARFFPEDDDTIKDIPGPNLKCNELLNRRATTWDMARAHVAALDQAAEVGFGLYIVSAPTPFDRMDAQALKTDAASVITRIFPEAKALYDRVGWRLPDRIGRIYDGRAICAALGFEYETDFATVLDRLHRAEPPPVDHDPDYVSPAWTARAGRR